MSISISLAGAQSSPSSHDFDNQCAADLSWYFHFWLLMLPGLLLDERVITGAPAWLKPCKFAFSTSVYSFTLYGCWACSNNIGDWLVWLQMPRLFLVVQIIVIIVQVVRVQPVTSTSTLKMKPCGDLWKLRLSCFGQQLWLR